MSVIGELVLDRLSTRLIQLRLDEPEAPQLPTTRTPSSTSGGESQSRKCLLLGTDGADAIEQLAVQLPPAVAVRVAVELVVAREHHDVLEVRARLDRSVGTVHATALGEHAMSPSRPSRALGVSTSKRRTSSSCANSRWMSDAI